jgi:hypothetical protein
MRILFIFSAIAILASCNNKDYNPALYISKPAQDSLIYSVIRYASKLPPNSDHNTKFESRFDEYYRAVASEYDIRAYYKDDKGIHYFLMTRPARSITPMRESIGCKLVYGRNQKIKEYEEVFRTWKMSEDQLNKKIPILFDRMVKGKSLEEYYPKNAGDQYIEFPDGRFYFDKNERKWRDHLIDSLNNRQ